MRVCGGALALVLAAASCGCRAEIPEGTFACDAARDCPSGWDCVPSTDGARYCTKPRAHDAGSLPDGTPADGAMDAGRSDARTPEDAGALRDASSDGCACPRDDEPDDPTDARDLGSFGPGERRSVGAAQHPDDSDWFRFTAADRIEVVLSDVAAGHDLDLSVYVTCGSGPDAPRCDLDGNVAVSAPLLGGCRSSAGGPGEQESVRIRSECESGTVFYAEVVSRAWVCEGCTRAYALSVTPY